MRTRMFSVAVLSVALLLIAIPASADDLPDLSGTWAMIQVLPEIADLPFIGKVSITAVVAILVCVEQTGSDVIMSDTYCRTKVLSDRTILTSEVPDTVMTSLDPAPRTARLEHVDGQWQLSQDWHVEVRGAVLENALTDPLPRGPFDPRVVDMDGDGHPGFTVPVAALGVISGDTYVVQRLGYAIAGPVLDPNSIEGAIEWASEQVVVGGTDILLLTTFEQWHDPDPMRHRFIMCRLNDDAACNAVIEILEKTVTEILENVAPSAEDDPTSTSS